MKKQHYATVRRAPRVAILGLSALLLAACAGPKGSTGAGNKGAVGAASDGSGSSAPQTVLGGESTNETMTPLQIRDRTRAFADYYRDKVAAVCDRVAEQTDDPAVARRVRQLKIDAVTAMYDIAIDPAPTTAMINALVMVSLQCVIAERHGALMFGNEENTEILAVAQQVQKDGFSLAARVMSQAQRQQLLDLVKGWADQNPTEVNIWYVRLNDLPGVNGQASMLEVVDSLTDLPGKFLGKFIPGVTTAGQSVSDVSLLAERMSWLAPRLLIVGQWRAEMLVYQSLSAPQIAESLELGQRVTDVVETLPATLTAQRQGLFEDLNQNDELVNGLLERTDSIVGHTSTLATHIDVILGRVQTMIAASAVANAGQPVSDVPARPFDITEYTAALTELDSIVQNANTLLDGVDSSTQEERLAAKMDVVKSEVSGLIWLGGGVLGGSIALAGVLIVLAVKLIPRRG